LVNPMSQTSPRILVVDDEPDICSCVQSYLGKRGIIVSTTGSGLEALSLLKSSKVDIVLLDITLNDISGIEVLKKFRGFNQETKVVIITGNTFSEEEVKEIIALGVSEYVNKPLILDDLYKIICSLLHNKPLPPAQRVYKRSEEEKEVSGRAVVHQLANLLNNIRTECDNFTSNLEDGIYQDKKEGELLKMSTEIMRDVMNTVDRMTEVVNQIKQKEE